MYGKRLLLKKIVNTVKYLLESKKYYRKNLLLLSEDHRSLEKELSSLSKSEERYRNLYYSLISLDSLESKIKLESEDLQKLYDYIKGGNYKNKTQTQEDLEISYYTLNNLLTILEEKNLIKEKNKKYVCNSSR